MHVALRVLLVRACVMCSLVPGVCVLFIGSRVVKPFYHFVLTVAPFSVLTPLARSCRASTLRVRWPASSYANFQLVLY